MVPGNDDAIRSIKLVSAAIADASIFGQQRRRDFMQTSRKDDGGSGVQIEFARNRANRAEFSNREPENKPD